MTPEEFSARAAVAVAPVEPSPGSYDRLRATVSRRRRSRVLVAGVATAVAAVMLGVALAMVPGTHHALPAGRQGVAAAGLDVDGDGVQDRAQVVDGDLATGHRWGVEVQRSRLGTVTVWMPGDRGTDGHGVSDALDVNVDGRAEILVATDDGDRHEYVLLAPDGDGLAWATVDGSIAVLGDATATPRPFGCVDTTAGRALAIETPHAPRVARTTYRLDGARLVRVTGADETQPLGSCETRPAG